MPMDYEQAVQYHDWIEDIANQVAENAEVLNKNNKIYYERFELLTKGYLEQLKLNEQMCGVIKKILDMMTLMNSNPGKMM